MRNTRRLAVQRAKGLPMNALSPFEKLIPHKRIKKDFFAVEMRMMREFRKQDSGNKKKRFEGFNGVAVCAAFSSRKTKRIYRGANEARKSAISLSLCR
ncbi:MAG: hypothetical protein ACTTKL_09360 [Treponema sp.]